MKADDVIKQKFTKVFRGYDVEEVDLFLDEVIRTIETFESERDNLLAQIEVLSNKISHMDD
ncbi:MAG TPA: DivIVA domain-containing protein [Clostridia bacterium]|nr:MAG: Cell cycle protein GpsB [Firmicutes bacterium ADurb.Bin356]HOF94678.1 DivIVA domain-containing protein [Clostridia bacterium]